MLGHLFELLLFILSHVVSSAFRKPVNKKCPFSSSVQNDGAVTLGFSMTWSSNALFDHAPAQVRINLTSLGFPNSFAKGIINDLLITCKTAEPSAL